MSADAVGEGCEFADEHCALPEFDLRYLFDDPDDPRTVTVYPGDVDGEAVTTTWISADVESAVSLAGAR